VIVARLERGWGLTRSSSGDEAEGRSLVEAFEAFTGRRAGRHELAVVGTALVLDRTGGIGR
jgi:hypothetical protein